MFDRILRHFPPHTYPLTLVSDPDNLLADEGILAALTERGFALVSEPDPVQLRHRMVQIGSFGAEQPVIVVTTGSLNQLPYDLWQQGQHVTLALHTFFPNLRYPVLKTLTPQQRWRLSQAPAPRRTLTRRASMDHILSHVFEVDWDDLREPAGLMAWLNRYHAQGPDQMPALLVQRWLELVRTNPTYEDWPLADLLADRARFSQFVAEQWLGYLQQETGQLFKEASAPYVLSFETDQNLQDTLPQLLRSGSLQPVALHKPAQIPSWAQVAVLAADENLVRRRAGELLEILAEQSEVLPEARWQHWQAVARTWAELTNLRYHPHDHLEPVQQLAYHEWQEKLDGAFFQWLRQRYAPLAAQRVPQPHHLYHVPHYIAYQRRQGRAQRVALLILDGMSLADWLLIETTWRSRHSVWRFQEHLVLAQIPTITAVSRQALVSGLRPADFAATLFHNRAEAQQWAGFWAREDLPASACNYARLKLGQHTLPPALDSPRVQALCLVNTNIDEMLHGASLGAADVQASLHLWLDGQAQQLEAIISGLLARDYIVYISSDHGHTEARGMGQPSEGLIVQTRNKRARVYRAQNAAVSARQDYPDTILWGGDGLLPDDTWILMPSSRNGRRLAFAQENTTVVTHGGLTLDEVVVPLVRIALAA